LKTREIFHFQQLML